MNKSMIRYILGYILAMQSALMLLPVVVAMLYREQEGIYYLGVALTGALIGGLIVRMWRRCPTVRCSGAASPTGLAAWEYWSFC